MSMFDHVTSAPPIEPFQLNKEFQEDSCPKKINLGIGVYKTEEGVPFILPAVRKVERLISEDDTLNHEYLPVLGTDAFCKAATRLLLGDCAELREGRAFGVQSLSGTGTLRVAAEFLTRVLGYNTAFISTPTWENHRLVCIRAGFKSVCQYRYWDPKTKGVDIHGLLEDLEKAEKNSVVILQACAHNPTGCDPSHKEWEKIADVIERNQLFPLFDLAYQGFSSGDVDKDAWTVRYFVQRKIEFMCAQSFAKNFGLYNERVGNLTVVVNDFKVIQPIKSQLTIIIRGMYSNPPNHGALVVSMILSNETFRESWLESVSAMAARIKEMRCELKDRLLRLQTPGDWDFITSQTGMFSYTGLNEEQVEYLKKKFHIYLLKSGRINMCGLNRRNLDYVAQAIDDTVKFCKKNCL